METYVKVYTVPEITVVVTPNATVGVEADEEVVFVINPVELLLKGWEPPFGL